MFNHLNRILSNKEENNHSMTCYKGISKKIKLETRPFFFVKFSKGNYITLYNLYQNHKKVEFLAKKMELYSYLVTYTTIRLFVLRQMNNKNYLNKEEEF